MRNPLFATADLSEHGHDTFVPSGARPRTVDARQFETAGHPFANVVRLRATTTSTS